MAATTRRGCLEGLCQRRYPTSCWAATRRSPCVDMTTDLRRRRLRGDLAIRGGQRRGVPLTVCRPGDANVPETAPTVQWATNVPRVHVSFDSAAEDRPRSATAPSSAHRNWRMRGHRRQHQHPEPSNRRRWAALCWRRPRGAGQLREQMPCRVGRRCQLHISEPGRPDGARRQPLGRTGGVAYQTIEFCNTASVAGGVRLVPEDTTPTFRSGVPNDNLTTPRRRRTGSTASG